MSIFVISLGIITLLAANIAYGFVLMEYARKKTEKAIAIYYRDHPLQCTMMLNQISLEETKKEIALQQMKNEENEKHIR